MNHETLANLLKCPVCSSEMRYHSKVFSYCCSGPVLHAFKIKDEIPNFVSGEPTKKQQKVDKAFTRIAGTTYEKIATGATAYDRAFIRIAYGTTKFIPLLFEFLESVASNCKPGFFLEIPVGTAIFTAGQYSIQPNLDFIVADYNMSMLISALEKIQASDFGNVMVIRADVCNLPFNDESFSGIMSMNGLHSFPDKKKSLDEMVRVLKSGGKIAGCFNVKGERLMSDIALPNIALWLGLYSSPFMTEQDFKQELESRGIEQIVTRKVGTMLFFSGKKANHD
ncbi:MAG: class I SAM-dependent methyltransferase [Actinomycetota bacterium]|nr:class I SAM-dependent methyltransferase [Actinomycetota bacterium]